LSAITGLDVEDVPGSRAPPFNQMENFETGNEMDNVRDQRYHSRRKRKEFASFMHEVVRRVPLSSTRNAILTKEERNRSFILEHIPEAVLASRVYFFVNIFGTSVWRSQIVAGDIGVLLLSSWSLRVLKTGQGF
jgi:hypothetical protein